MRVGIVGSRGFTAPDLVRAFVRSLPKDATVVSGGAQGVDSWAVGEAKILGLNYKEWPANWKQWGKAAGFIRNQTIVDDSDIVVAFWDGKSNGTADTIVKARKAGKATYVVYATDELPKIF
jgi:hypothetical protein